MKVCLLNESFPPVIDGVVNVMMNYADYMMRDYGAEIEVGTPEYPDGKYDDYPYQVVAYPSFDTAAQTNGYRAGNPLVKSRIETCGIQARYHSRARTRVLDGGGEACSRDDRRAGRLYLSHEV